MVKNSFLIVAPYYSHPDIFRIQPDNVALTLQAIEAMAKRYSGRKNLVGFELLNEPAEEYGGRLEPTYCLHVD